MKVRWLMFPCFIRKKNLFARVVCPFLLFSNTICQFRSRAILEGLNCDIPSVFIELEAFYLQTYWFETFSF